MLVFAAGMPAHARTLKVGVYPNAPKLYVDDKGQAAGILVDLLREIAREEKWTLEFVPCDWESCLRAVQAGDVDLLPDVAYSEERSRILNFHRTPALHSWSQIYRHPDARIVSLPDLKGKRVAVLRGSIQQHFLTGLIESFDLNATLIPVDSLETAFAMARDKRVDVAVANKFFGGFQSAHYRLEDTPIVFQPVRLFYAAGAGRHPDLMTAVDRHLAAWQADQDSVYFEILRRWQAPAMGSSIPSSVWWSLAMVLSMLALALGIAAMFRRQVAARTRDLRSSEQKLAAILDGVDSLIYIKDKNYRYQYANRAMCQLLGISPRDIIGKDDTEITDVLTAAKLRESDRQVIELGKRVAVEESKAGHEARGPTYFSVKIPLCRDTGEVYALCGISTDITERKRSEDALRIAATVFQSQEAMFVTGPDRHVLDVNDAFVEMSGHAREEIIGDAIPPVYLEDMGADARAAIFGIVNREGKWQGEVWTQRKNGQDYPAWLAITAVLGEGKQVSHYVGTLQDITQRKLTQDQIFRLAYHDSLTGLPNRRLLLDRLEQCLTMHQRGRNSAALLFIDIDNFKDLNDTSGHEVGDKLLQQVALRLSGCCRQNDTVARIGGDEFVLLLEDVGHGAQEAADHAAAIGWKILGEIGQPYIIDGMTHHATCSIGVTLCGGHGVQIMDLMKQGDLAMYQAKRDGRNTLRFFHGDMESAVAHRIGLEAEMRKALQASQFRLHYQPQVDRDGRMNGVEALLRWEHPERGSIAPDMVISIAEASGLVLPLGHWVMETACRQLAAWAADASRSHLTIAVNVSAHQFRQPDFVARTVAALTEAGAAPHRLKIEITETMLIENMDDTIVKMKSLKAQGIGFSLDDFGTGYSSLAYLKRLPLDQLKIDRSFVRDVLTDPNDATIARSIVALAKSLGLDVIAEGVETPAQHDFLAEIGCDGYQGYLFGRPVDIHALDALLAAPRRISGMSEADLS